MEREWYIARVIEAMRPVDWPAVHAIYLEGIAGGNATFETEAPPWEVWDAKHLDAPRLVFTDPNVLGWAALSRVSPRECYAGVCEVSVYVASEAQGRGIGSQLLRALVEQSEANGIWTLQASVFPQNEASVRIHQSCGFRIVGRRERIAQLRGVWRDTLLLERRAAR